MPATFVDLPEVLVNLSNAGSDRTQYLKVKVVLELPHLSSVGKYTLKAEGSFQNRQRSGELKDVSPSPPEFPTPPAGDIVGLLSA